MKPITLTLVILIGLIFNQVCVAETVSASYSDFLKEAVDKSRNLAGFQILHRDSYGLAMFVPRANELSKKEAVPFLIEVIQNGPEWQAEYKGTKRLFPHVARCYAVLCLTVCKDEQAYPILSNLLENGIPPIDPNTLKEEIQQEQMEGAKSLLTMMLEGDPTDSNLIASSAARVIEEIEQEYDIRQYAAAGLGLLEDPRAVNILVAALNDTDSKLRNESMLALAKINDMRAIEPILNMAMKYETNGFALNGCMQKMTKHHIKRDINQEDNTIVFPDYPEFGVLQLEGKSREPLYKEFWSRWYKNGKNLIKQKFEGKFNNYSKTKHDHPNNQVSIGAQKRKISKLGVAVLPLIIQEIEQGQTDLIPLVAQLTDNEVNRDATLEDVINWWQLNKEKWIIFDYQVN